MKIKKVYTNSSPFPIIYGLHLFIHTFLDYIYFIHIFSFYFSFYRYTQGMSDLLAPVLCEIKNESETFWCFVGLMQRAIFVCTPTDNDIDRNLVSSFNFEYFFLILLFFLFPFLP